MPRVLDASDGDDLAAPDLGRCVADSDDTALVPDGHAIEPDDDGSLRGYSLLVNRPARDPDVVAALKLVPSVELSKCYVHPEHHGLGAAAELMHASLQAAAAAGGAGVWLGVNSQNGRAIRFYEKSGFRKSKHPWSNSDQIMPKRTPGAMRTDNEDRWFHTTASKGAGGRN